MPDNGFGRCDGHHEMVVSDSKKIRSNTHGWKRKPRGCRGFSRLANEGCLEWAEYSRPILLSRRRLAMTIRVSPRNEVRQNREIPGGELPETEVAACRIVTAACASWDGTQARSESSRVENRADAVSAACEHVSWLGERLSVLPRPSIRTPPWLPHGLGGICAFLIAAARSHARPVRPGAA